LPGALLETALEEDARPPASVPLALLKVAADTSTTLLRAGADTPASLLKPVADPVAAGLLPIATADPASAAAPVEPAAGSAAPNGL
jgi:hypothetical protein